MSNLKKNLGNFPFRTSYNDDINNLGDFNDSLEFLVELGNIEKKDYYLFSLISNFINNIMINYRDKEIHEELVENLDYIWDNYFNFKIKHPNSYIEKLNVHLDYLIKKYSNNVSVISLLRIPEYYYVSHSELKSKQGNITSYMELFPMLIKDKSIFQIEGKELTCNKIAELNLSYINKFLGYKVNLPSRSFKEYLNLKNISNPSLRKYIYLLKENIKKYYKKIYLDNDIISYHSKCTSPVMEGMSSIVEENFFTYDSKLFTSEFYNKVAPYPKILLKNINYDYLNLSLGLGPNFKIRNVAFTNANIQNIGDIIRKSSKKSYNQFIKLYGLNCPIRTDNQSEKFINNLNTNKNIKLCYDLSKYSDYLIINCLEDIIDFIVEDSELSSTLKKIYNIPAKIQNKLYSLPFGSAQGVKGNFDLITLANALIIDYCASNNNIEYTNLNVVGDDMYCETNDKQFPAKLREYYSLFNCKVNAKKAHVAYLEGHISFCNYHYYITENEVLPLSGLSPNSWIKDKYSFNRYNSIISKLINTNQYSNFQYDIILNDIERNKPKISREIEINKNNNYRYKNYYYNEKIQLINFNKYYNFIKTLPLEMGGLKILKLEEVNDLAYLDNYISKYIDCNKLMISDYESNKRLQISLSKMIAKFGINHPLISKMLSGDNDFLIHIKEVYDKSVIYKNDKSLYNLKSLLKSINKMTIVSVRKNESTYKISTKDRTDDYSFEDKLLVSYFNFLDHPVENANNLGLTSYDLTYISHDQNILEDNNVKPAHITNVLRNLRLRGALKGYSEGVFQDIDKNTVISVTKYNYHYSKYISPDKYGYIKWITELSDYKDLNNDQKEFIGSYIHRYLHNMHVGKVHDLVLYINENII